MNPELLRILVCPETKEPVELASQELVKDLNQRVEAGQLLNRAGKPVTQLLEQGLIRKDEQVLYPVRNSIPVMLVEEGIPLQS